MARCPTCHRRLIAGAACAAHGGPAPDVPAPPLGAPPPWATPLGAPLGAGGFATVWALEDGAVLKVAHTGHALARAQIAREAEALAEIGAPAVPRLHHTGVFPDGRAWITMERVVGASLVERVAAGALGADAAIALGLAILDALIRVHAARFVHRDLKPDNLVVRPDGRVVVLDLGLARRRPVDPTDPARPDVRVGSLEYMAPEQIQSSAGADERSDLYSFGCVLYELFAGRPPFVGDEAAVARAHLALRPPALGALVRVTGTLEAVVMECLAKDPARRPPSARAVHDRLLAARAEVSSQLVSHVVSMIAVGKQPVLLVWAELPRVDRALLGTLTARRARIASQRGRRVILAFVGSDHPDPGGAAVAAARDLAMAGARVAVHLDALALAPGSADVALTGPAIDAPEGWLPVTAWTGVALTRAAATVLQAPTRDAGPLGAEFRLLAEVGAEADVFGRDALLADLATDAAGALVVDRGGAGPALALLLGEPGVGKSTFATALARRIRELGVAAHVIAIPAPGTGRTGSSALVELVGTPVGPAVRAIGDALRARARSGPVAVILDDLHHAEHELLDALEYATLGGEPLPLWVLGVASPRFDARRPGFGRRAERHRRDALLPLDEDAAVAMAAALLRPVEYPPLRALRQLAAVTRGNPTHMSTLLKEIHERGAVRQRPNGEHFLDIAALDTLAPTPLGPWLAARLLAGLGEETVSLARLCAVLGEEFSRAELAGVVARVEAAGGATTTIDLDVGLAELGAAGVIVPGRRDWRFPQPLVEDGLYATTDEAARAAVHAAALGYWTAADRASPETLARIAHHAEAIGADATAADAYVALGARAQRENRLFDADRAWEGAVRHLPTAGLARAHAVLGRARARYRLMKLREALRDLDEVLAAAVALGDAELELAVHCERAMALDLMDEWAGSRAAGVAARAALERVPAARRGTFALDVALAEARHAFRERDFTAAAPALARVIAEARAHGRPDLEAAAGLLHAPALVELADLAAAEAAFDDVIALCRRERDLYHLGAAYANRAALWSAKGDLAQSTEDLRAVIQIAREESFSGMERVASYNFAEDRLWSGALEEALPLARRSLALQRDHGEGVATVDQLLVARIQAMAAQPDELAASLRALGSASLSESDAAVVAILRCVAERAPHADWRRALARLGADLDPTLRIELAVLAVRHQALSEGERREVRAEATAHPIWTRRADEL